MSTSSETTLPPHTHKTRKPKRPQPLHLPLSPKVSLNLPVISKNHHELDKRKGKKRKKREENYLYNPNRRISESSCLGSTNQNNPHCLQPPSTNLLHGQDSPSSANIASPLNLNNNHTQGGQGDWAQSGAWNLQPTPNMSYVKTRNFSAFTRRATVAEQPEEDVLLKEQSYELRRMRLKYVNRTSALLAGFAMVAMVEVSLDSSGGTEYPTVLLVAFSVCTTLLVVVHLISLMISTCLLPNMEVHREFRNRAIAANITIPSPVDGFKSHIETAWVLSTGVGLILMMLDIGLLIAIKFYPLEAAFPWVMGFTATIVVPATIGFMYFALQYYRKLTKQKFDNQAVMLSKMQDELELVGNEFHPGASHPNFGKNVSVIGPLVISASQQGSVGVGSCPATTSIASPEPSPMMERNFGNRTYENTSSNAKSPASSIQDFQDCNDESNVIRKIL